MVLFFLGISNIDSSLASSIPAQWSGVLGTRLYWLLLQKSNDENEEMTKKKMVALYTQPPNFFLLEEQKAGLPASEKQLLI